MAIIRKTPLDLCVPPNLVDYEAARAGFSWEERGVRHMTAEILAENALMLNVFRDLGWSRALRHDGTVVHLELDLSPAVLERSAEQ